MGSAARVGGGREHFVGAMGVVSGEVNPAAWHAVRAQELHSGSRIRVREIGGRASSAGAIVQHTEPDILENVAACCSIDRAQLNMPLPKSAICGANNAAKLQAHGNRAVRERECSVDEVDGKAEVANWAG